MDDQFAWSQIANTSGFQRVHCKTGDGFARLAGFIALTIWIVSAGVEKGIEKWSVLMPILFVMMLVIIGRSLTLEGPASISYYLNPDFSKIDGKVVLMALGQAFFSLSVGWGLMITYGSYMPKNKTLCPTAYGWLRRTRLWRSLLASWYFRRCSPLNGPGAGRAYVCNVA